MIARYVFGDNCSCPLSLLLIQSTEKASLPLVLSEDNYRIPAFPNIISRLRRGRLHRGLEPRIDGRLHDARCWLGRFC